eukprot:13980802-Ditylum_brightwellii.AAC.1
MKKQVKRLRMARPLLNSLWLLPNMYSPRRHTNLEKIQFPVPDGVTATNISCEEFVDILEDEILYQWKLEFEKEWLNLRSSTLKEFLD